PPPPRPAPFPYTTLFRSAADSARARTDRALEIQSLTTAAQLYEDDLLPALYDDWLTPLREDYRRRISEVLHRLATLFEEGQEYRSEEHTSELQSRENLVC